MKDKQRTEADKNRGLFLKSNINLIWLLEIVNLLFAACVGYIQSRAPIRGEGNAEAPADDAADPDEVRILKRDFVTARHKANNGDDAAGQRMEQLKEQLIKMGAEIPEERTKKRRVGY